MTETLEQLVVKLGETLSARRWTLSTAESCTGGGVAYHITQVPSCSTWFERGFVTYSNSAKQELLNVRQATLDTFGAVSAETAREMADGALQNSLAQMSIAITGIAGPSGGSSTKPVGTVWFAWARTNLETVTKCCQFKGDRQRVREQAIREALKVAIELTISF